MTPSKNHPSTADQRSLSILIVEDVPEMSELLRHILETIPGFQVTGIAKNGAEARLELTRRHPDLILLDEILPGESSQDLLAEFLRQKISTILITGFSQERKSEPPDQVSRMIKPGWETLKKDQIRIQKFITNHLGKKS